MYILLKPCPYHRHHHRMKYQRVLAQHRYPQELLQRSKKGYQSALDPPIRKSHHAEIQVEYKKSKSHPSTIAQYFTPWKLIFVHFTAMTIKKNYGKLSVWTVSEFELPYSYLS